MPTFDFTGGSFTSNSTQSTFTLDFTDNGVNFTLSTTGNANPAPTAYNPGAGYISITDSTPAGTFILDVNNTGAPLTNFGAEGGNISLDIDFVSSTWNITFVHETNAALNQVFTVSSTLDAATISFATSENYSEIRFSPTTPGGAIQIDSLTASITCYLEGTSIATPEGSVSVETLKAGDKILTADGGTATVRWLGVQPIDTRQATPAKANPICIKAGALAPNVPARDLFVSPDHAMEIDGLLYNAAALVNGRSIYQVAQMPLDGFTYYHIDTGSHELILAEGAASETYLDAVGRDAFINGHEQADAPIITEMAVPRIVAKRMVPHDVVEQLEERANALGLAPRSLVA